MSPAILFYWKMENFLSNTVNSHFTILTQKQTIINRNPQLFILFKNYCAQFPKRRPETCTLCYTDAVFTILDCTKSTKMKKLVKDY